jgi:hypothetical protein
MELNMQEEKHHSRIPLAGRLDELESLPAEERFDKTQAWEKLYGRLHKKRNHILSFRRWRAVAIVLPAALLLGVFIHKAKRPAGNDTGKPVARQAAQPESVKQTQPAAEPSHRVTWQRAPERRMGPVFKARRPESGKELHKATGFTAAPAFSALTKDSLTGVTDLHPSPDPALAQRNLATAKPVPAKRKLRVLHVNELDEPEPENNLAGSAGPRGFRLRWIGSSVPANGLPDAAGTQHELVKIMLSSSN